jgi:UDP-N-acetylglucosamine 2-epimerase (non-hydrolysing)
MKKKICIVFGTRPEAIKLAPVVLTLKRESDLELCVCVTAQHREMLDQVLEIFGIVPDIDLNLMKPAQTLSELTARAVTALDKVYAREKPDIVISQGDTTTAFVASLVAFYHQTRIAHVEAGLRTYNLRAPWPEEGNRVLVSGIADIHFAPTEGSRNNLLKECVPGEKVHVTGNTVIDALFLALEKTRKDPPMVPGLGEDFFAGCREQGKRLILVTGHRRENFGRGFENICLALQRLAQRKDIEVVYPVHLNPNVKKPVNDILGSLDNITLIEPLPYLPFIHLMDQAHFVITDSGGIQEEAPSLGKPVLVMRETTERPEAVDAGTVRLVGTDVDKIVGWAETLLDEKAEYEKMSFAHNPYGDGKASERIRDILKAYEDV